MHINALEWELLTINQERGLNMIENKIIIDGVDYSQYLPYPVKDTLTRDESLDNSIIQLIENPFKKPFKPLTTAQIIKVDNSGEETLYMVVAVDKVDENIANGTFTHNLTLIEETKKLERLQIGGKTVTNSTASSFLNSLQIEGLYKLESATSVNPTKQIFYPFKVGDTVYQNVFSPTNSTDITIMSPLLFPMYSQVSKVEDTTVSLFNNNVKIWEQTFELINNDNPIAVAPLLKDGEYRLHYNTGSGISRHDIDFYFYKTDNPVLFALLDFEKSSINIPTSIDGVGTLPGLDGQPVPVGTEISSQLFDKVLTPVADNVKIYMGNGIILNAVSGATYVLSEARTYAFLFTRDNKQFFYFIQAKMQDEIDKLKKKKTITEVVQGLLNTYNTLYVGETPEITFDSTQADKYSSVESPQLSFTNQMNLWEAFSIVGDVIHGIPRLKNNVLSFDLLGESKQSEVALDNYVVNEQNQSVEQFCSEIVSTINNVVNYSEAGTVVEPDTTNYKTLRIESGLAYIDEGELLIQTQYPIEKLIKVECGVLPDGSRVGDITSNVWEKSEYDVLSSYTASYPNAKCYAIYWTKGQQNIKGLTFKKPNIFSSAFENYAIQNIICKITGKTYNWFTSLFNNELALQNLMFRVTYIPRTDIKAKQTKAYVEDLLIPSQMAYNQNSTLIDSDAFGESMKGAVARMGNIDIVRTYIFDNISQIPNIGDFVIIDNDEYYITNIMNEVYPQFIQSQIAFSKDFNRLNEYVGVKNELRFYEVAVDQCIDRYVGVQDYCVIGDAITSDNNTVIKRNGVNAFAHMFFPKDTAEVFIEAKKQATALVDISQDNENFTQYEIPVISYGLGNASVFNFSFQDNFSVGDKIVEIDSEATSGTPNRVQQAVQYGDSMGEVKYLKFGLVSNMGAWIGYNAQKEFGDNLPETLTKDTSTYFNSPTILLEKDNREKIKLNYQISFIANKKSLVVGSGLGSANLLVNQKLTNGKLFVSPNRLNKFARTIDTTGMTEFQLNTANIAQQLSDLVNPLSFNLSTFTSTVAGKSWLIVNENNGRYELLIGENMEIEAGQTITLPTFTFTHKILTNSTN